MHELGIIIHISKTLKEVAEENEVTKIGSVTLEIGEVSGIVIGIGIAYRDASGGNHVRELQKNLSDCKIRQTMSVL